MAKIFSYQFVLIDLVEVGADHHRFTLLVLWGVNVVLDTGEAVRIMKTAEKSKMWSFFRGLRIGIWKDMSNTLFCFLYLAERWMLSSPSASSRADILRPGMEALFADEDVATDRLELAGGGCGRTGSFLAKLVPLLFESILPNICYQDDFKKLDHFS